jgi:hypothetical protein
MPNSCNKKEILDIKAEAYPLLSVIVCHPGYSPTSPEEDCIDEDLV